MIEFVDLKLLYQNDMSPDFKSIQKVIQNRRTLKRFEAIEIDKNEMEELVELIRWAPNHRMTEPWRVYGLNQKRIMEWTNYLKLNLLEEELLKMEGAMKRVQTAAYVLHITSLRVPENSTWDEENYASVCCGIQNLLLGAEAKGFSSFWSTGRIASHPLTSQFLKIDTAGEKFVGSLWLGGGIKPEAPARKTIDQYLKWS